jgi:hypothetical protein
MSCRTQTAVGRESQKGLLALDMISGVSEGSWQEGWVSIDFGIDRINTTKVHRSWQSDPNNEKCAQYVVVNLQLPLYPNFFTQTPEYPKLLCPNPHFLKTIQ